MTGNPFRLTPRGGWGRILRPGSPALAHVVGFLMVLGAILGSVTLILPHPPQGESGICGLAGGALVVGAALIVLGRRTPAWAIHASIAAGSAAICAAIVASGVSAGIYGVMLFWVALVSAYFFRPLIAWAHLGWILACFGAALATVETTGGYSPIARWITTAFALSVVTSVTSWLVAHRAQAERRAQRFLEVSRDLLCTVDEDGRFVEINEAGTRILGYPDAELIGKPFIELVHPEDLDGTVREAAGVLEASATNGFQNRYVTGAGELIWLEWNSTYIPADGLIYARATDITEQKLLEGRRAEQLATASSQARTDELTGLPNRRWLDDELEREIARSRRREFPLSLGLVDLDHFKRFNDTHGHLLGDACLVEAAAAWSDELRATDFLARFGGEEFIALLPDCEAADAQLVLERLIEVTPRGQTCSAGVATMREGEAPDELIGRADRALYAAKRGGRARVVVDGAHDPLGRASRGASAAGTG
jgi:diguanylate cyclase (GGDEF)-like protein/PAS domain S-box-containing protein